MPSVARTRTSPGRTSIVDALMLGSSCPGMPLRSARDPFGHPAERSPLTTRPSTLPTPSQVIEFSAGETNARLIAAPRVSRKALWQRSTRRTRSRLGRSRTTCPAALAARAASRPCPRPSIAATSAPSGSSWTTARSPLVPSPGRHLVATPHSTGYRPARSTTLPVLLAQARQLVAEPPFPHRHGGAGVRARHDLEVVHQATRSRKAEPKPAAAAVVVADRRLDVANAGPVVVGDDHEAVPVLLLERPQDDFPMAG